MALSDFTEYRGNAQAMVTRLRAVARALEVDADCDPLLLALTLADLVAYVHHRWATATDVDEDQAWRELLLDVAEWETSA